MLAATQDFLRLAGYESRAIADWALEAERRHDKLVVLVTPVAPSPSDLRQVDVLRQRGIAEDKGIVARAFLVHEAPDTDPDAHALVDWIVAGRPLKTATVAAFPQELS